MHTKCFHSDVCSFMFSTPQDITLQLCCSRSSGKSMENKLFCFFSEQKINPDFSNYQHHEVKRNQINCTKTVSVCMAQHSAGENVTTTVQRYANLDTQLAK